MKIAIISDIHSNLEALNKAMEIIDERQVDEIVCLGDVVGYGANPNECVDIVRSRCSVTVLGNHDAAALDTSAAYDFNAIAKSAVYWTADQLSEASNIFLSTLPMVERKKDILLVHSSPCEPEAWEYIVDSSDAMFSFQCYTEKICFIGHSHVPGIYSPQGRSKAISMDTQYLVNVGSVGQPRDGNPMLSFGILDTVEWQFELIRSEYDIETAAQKIIDAGLPEQLANRLFYGM